MTQMLLVWELTLRNNVQGKRIIYILRLLMEEQPFSFPSFSARKAKVRFSALSKANKETVLSYIHFLISTPQVAIWRLAFILCLRRTRMLIKDPYTT